MIKLLKIMYVKWIIGQCPHFCCFCEFARMYNNTYKQMCDTEMLHYYDSNKK